MRRDLDRSLDNRYAPSLRQSIQSQSQPYTVCCTQSVDQYENRLICENQLSVNSAGHPMVNPLAATDRLSVDCA